MIQVFIKSQSRRSLSQPWHSRRPSCRAMILEKWSGHVIQSLSVDTHRCIATRKSSDRLKLRASHPKVVAAGCLHRKVASVSCIINIFRIFRHPVHPPHCLCSEDPFHGLCMASGRRGSCSCSSGSFGRCFSAW